MTRMIPTLPGAKTYRLKSTAEIYQTEWKLTPTERKALTSFALRKWSIAELLSMLEFAEDGIHLTIRLWNVVYSVRLQVSAKMHSYINYQVAKSKDRRFALTDKFPQFWLSFRAGYLDGAEFAYVIVQEDKSEG